LTNLKSLELEENEVSDISALSDLTNLTQLYLDFNSGSDISALSGLTNLKSLELEENEVSDISALSAWLNVSNNKVSDLSPLVANTGLVSKNEVNVKGNPLSSSSIRTHIPALQRRGVRVEFDN
jgi:internalin A